MSGIGLYVAGNGPAHRASAGLKLLVLLVVVAAMLLVDDLLTALGVVAAAIVLYPLCGLSPRHVWHTVRPLLVFVAAIAAFQWYAADVQTAMRVCAQLVAAVLLAGLVTLTTRVSAMLALFERLAGPLRFVGVRPDRVALTLALTIRCVPLVASAYRTSRDAYAARGLRGRPYLLIVPVIVGLIRSAEAMGEAMVARGLD